MNRLEDKDLVQKIVAGDHKLFKVLLDQTGKLVTLIVYRMIQNRQDREDLIQDIYLIVFNKLSAFRFESKLSTWVASIAVNVCSKKLRGANKNKYVDPLNKMDIPESPDDGSKQKDDYGWLDQLIQELPEAQRLTISLFHQQDLSLEEIHKITDIPIGTIKSHLVRGRIKLKELITKTRSNET